MKRVLGMLLFGSVGIWLTFPGSPALACTCDVAPIRAHLATAQTVFRGEVVSVSATAERQHVKFRVLFVYKGEPTQFVDVTSATTPDLCGIQFGRESEYVVFAQGDAADYRTSLCNGTTDDLSILERDGVSGRAMEIAVATARSDEPSAPLSSRSPLALPTAATLLSGVVVAHAQRARVVRRKLAQARSRYAGT